MSDNTANNKRIAKNTLLLYVRMFFMMGVYLFTSRVVLQTLGVNDYGIYNVVGGTITMISFITSSLAAGATRFITISVGKNDELEKKKIYGGIMALQLVLSVCIFVLGETVGLWFVMTQLVIPADRLVAALWVYQFSIVICIVGILSVPYIAEITAYEHINVYATIAIIDAFLKLVIVYLLLLFDGDKLIIYAMLLMAVQLIDGFMYFSYCYKHFKEVKGKIQIDRLLAKEVMTYSGWTLTGGLTTMTCNQGINVFLNIFFGPAVNAARGVATQVQIAVLNFSSNFQTALSPQITKSYAISDYNRISELVTMGTKFSFYLLLIITIPVLFKLNFLLSLWLGEVPEYTLEFVLLLLVINLIHSALGSPLIYAVNATGDIKKFQIVEGLCLVTIIPISYLVYKLGGMNPIYIFITYLIIELITQIFRTIIVLPKIQMSYGKYMKTNILPIVKVSLFVLPLSFVVTLTDNESWCNFFLVSIVEVLIVASSVYLLGLTEKEKEIVVKYINKVFHSELR